MSGYEAKPTARNFRLRQDPSSPVKAENFWWHEIDPDGPAPGGALIAEARRRAVITQSELARRMGVQQQSISRWERGVADPGFGAVLAALGACGWDLVGSLAPRTEGRVLPKNVPAIHPAQFVLTPQDKTERLDQRISNLRVLKNSQREWRREQKSLPPQD
jgi:transcriptional regulator with XRE-family HTH domain